MNMYYIGHDKDYEIKFPLCSHRCLLSSDWKGANGIIKQKQNERG